MVPMKAVLTTVPMSAVLPTVPMRAVLPTVPMRANDNSVYGLWLTTTVPMTAVLPTVPMRAVAEDGAHETFGCRQWPSCWLTVCCW